MEEVVSPTKETKRAFSQDTTRKQIRGSTLLLLGRFLAVGINFASQVLIVRYLTKSDYGSWAYALAIVAFFHGLSSLGLRRAITRFIPIYHEKEEFEKLFGTLFLTFGTNFLSTFLIVGAIYSSPETISHLISGEEQPVTLVLILIFMVPVEAIDGILIGLFASFASPRTIFTRKFIVGPCIKLTAVILLIVYGSDVLILAYGFLFGNVIAILFYTWMLFRMMRNNGTLEKFNLKNINIPAKEVFSFTIPLLTSDLVTILLHSSDTLILGYFHATEEVALYQVILPAAHFNKLVMMSFALLYTPIAARLFAKNDYAGINNLYWQTAIWLGVLSFPVFALTFSLAEPLTVFLYGARYETSWIFLQLLALGYYFNVVLGFNGLTLKVLGKLRYVVIINVIAVVINLILNLLLIPPYGALGASIATAASMIVHNILKQAGLRLASGIAIFDWHYLSFYIVISACAIGVFLFQFFVTNNIFILIPLLGAVSLLMIKLLQEKLNLEETFPELLRLPFLKSILNFKIWK